MRSFTLEKGFQKLLNDLNTGQAYDQKLDHYGFHGVINKWFPSYLEGRTQTTQIGSFISKRKNTTCGVPQGSVLGPLLFLIYVNDIQESSDKLKFFLFADDTNAVYADKNLKSLESIQCKSRTLHVARLVKGK